MVIEVNNPIGLDSLILRCQKALFTKLVWSELLNIYPRAYKVYRDEMTTIEHYSSKDDYVNLIEAEENKCFFVASDTKTKENAKLFSTDLFVFFTVNLNDIYPDDINRSDAKIHNDVFNALKNVGNSNITEIITGIENVYRGYTIKANDDMQPYHCFRITMSVNYTLDEKCCC